MATPEEREALARAAADIGAGCVVDGPKVMAWLRAKGTRREPPRPEPDTADG